MLKICKKLQEKRFVFVKILAIIIPENGAKVSKIKCLRLNQQTLFKDDQFRSITNEAKALYMILLDRRCLSECNGDAWRDEYGATFIIFTIKEMMKLLHLGNKKINKMLKELEVHNLIYRSHQGLGKPNKIYVYDLLKADNDNWLPKQFKHRKGRTNEKEIL